MMRLCRAVKNEKEAFPMKKILSLLFAFMLIFSCAGFAAAESSGSVYFLNFKPEQAQQWEDLAKAYTAETGVQVTVLTAASGTYEQTLASEIVKKNAPTLFQVNGPKTLAAWKDYCADLSGTQLYKNVKSDDFVLKQGDAVVGIAYVIETYGIIYNKELMAEYIDLDGARISDVSEINNFATFKAVVEDMQARKKELGIMGAFASAGMDSSSDWRFKTHLANMPIYYEYLADGIGDTEAIKGTYLDNYKQIWDLYINNSTCAPAMIGAKTGSDALADFVLGDAVFYQNGTWEYGACIDEGMTDDQLGMLPIFIGVEGEENQGLCTGSENYWCVNNKASAEDQAATIAFMEWCITSDTGRNAIANEMGFLTPFTTFDDGYVAHNALIAAADAYIAAGKTSVSWTFPTMPSENWKNGVGVALLAYAQGTGEWSAVVDAFVNGWAVEAAAAK